MAMITIWPIDPEPLPVPSVAGLATGEGAAVLADPVAAGAVVGAVEGPMLIGGIVGAAGEVEGGDVGSGLGASATVKT
jgi:hypothetical protein